MTAHDRPRIGISACLLGEAVRHDGSHRRDRWLVDAVGPLVEWVPVCPEAEAGFGVPRPAVRLARDDSDRIRMVESRSGRDVTSTMREYAAQRVSSLATCQLDGFVLKKGSPSCGLHRVGVSLAGGGQAEGRGLFAAALGDAMPLLAAEEEGRLRDAALREHFFTRVFAALRLRALSERQPRAAQLMAFHARHKYLLMAHSPAWCRKLGRLLAAGTAGDAQALLSEYRVGYLAALAQPATVGRNVNVLQHLLGAVAGISGSERVGLLATIDDYRLGRVPLVAPVRLLRQILIEHDASRSWAAEQIYLAPYPDALALRSAV